MNNRYYNFRRQKLNAVIAYPQRKMITLLKTFFLDIFITEIT